MCMQIGYLNLTYNSLHRLKLPSAESYIYYNFFMLIIDI